MTPVLIASVSKFVTPKRVDVPPVVYLYSSISTATFTFALMAKWVTQAQFPEGRFVAFGTPESVA